jgi:hypothetical protein
MARRAQLRAPGEEPPQAPSEAGGEAERPRLTFTGAHGVVECLQGTFSVVCREDGAYPKREGAWVLYSRRFDREFWLVRDDQALDVIRDEVSGRPVVFVDELEVLRTLDAATIRAVLDAKAVMGPGTRLVSDQSAEVADGGVFALAPPPRGDALRERITDKLMLDRRGA